MKELSKLQRLVIAAVLVLVNVGCDQATKAVARRDLAYGEMINVLGDFFVLTKVENTGAFLSLGSELGGIPKMLLLNALPILVMVGLFIYLVTRPSLHTRLLVGFSFVIGGGVGNIIDRLQYGSVTDFMYMELGPLHTGVFNAADVSVMVGFGLVILDGFGKKKPSEPQAEHEGGATQ